MKNFLWFEKSHLQSSKFIEIQENSSLRLLIKLNIYQCSRKFSSNFIENLSKFSSNLTNQLIIELKFPRKFKEISSGLRNGFLIQLKVHRNSEKFSSGSRNRFLIELEIYQNSRKFSTGLNS